METKNKKNPTKNSPKKETKEQPKISKTGLAMRKLWGTGEILDMRAVLK
ncbi:MAG: hypothetical protein QM564_12575 [Bergeyella sp.]